MEKINVAELLKDCPRDMELDCTMYDNLYFDSLNADYYGTINCYTLIDGIKTSINLTKYGTFNNHPGAKCVIFPKGKTTWEGFHRPFKDGDIVSTMHGVWIGIVKKSVNSSYETYITINGESLVYDNPIFCFEKFATEEEKQKLFQAIKENGYRWNHETKTLDKLIRQKFKVGDRIRQKGEISTYTITDVNDAHYFCGKYVICDTCDDNWELVSNKFDITTLVPFESRVLVRDNVEEKWHPGIWGFYDDNSYNSYQYKLIGDIARYCIPYEGNEHLLGKTDDCDEHFKTWK